jgi:hypothetical protein
MTWLPGTPIVSEQDHLEWDAWRRERILTAQRHRRSRLRRIDYADVSAEAAAVIDALRTGTGSDVSSILNTIILRWARANVANFRNKVGLSENTTPNDD